MWGKSFLFNKFVSNIIDSEVNIYILKWVIRGVMESLSVVSRIR
jgi:hypothetical protein